MSSISYKIATTTLSGVHYRGGSGTASYIESKREKKKREEYEAGRKKAIDETVDELKSEEVAPKLREALISGDKFLYYGNLNGEYTVAPRLLDNFAKDIVKGIQEKKGYGLSFKMGMIYSGFSEQGDMSDFERQKVERAEKFAELEKTMAEDTTGYYDKMGAVAMPLYLQRDKSRNLDKIATIAVPCTLRELATLGILPNDSEFKEQEVILAEKEKASSIAKMGKEAEVREDEIEDTKNVFQRMLTKLRERNNKEKGDI